MIAELLGRFGYATELVIARAGTRGTVIATRHASRELVTLVPGELDGAILAAHGAWDLPLAGVRVVETDDGPRTLIAESLPEGIPSTDLPGLQHGEGAGSDPAPTGVPAFVPELVGRMADAHRVGLVVGPLQPALVFVRPGGGGLAGVAQRPLRADAAARKGEGSPSLFGPAFLTPADVRGEDPTPGDDVFRLASMVWRWRHGEEHLAGLPLGERFSILAGVDTGTLEARRRERHESQDDLDALLERSLDPSTRPRPALADLLDALRAVGSSW